MNDTRAASVSGLNIWLRALQMAAFASIAPNELSFPFGAWSMEPKASMS